MGHGIDKSYDRGYGQQDREYVADRIRSEHSIQKSRIAASDLPFKGEKPIDFFEPTSKEACDFLNRKFTEKYVAVRSPDGRNGFISQKKYEEHKRFWDARKIEYANAGFDGKQVVDVKRSYTIEEVKRSGSILLSSVDLGGNSTVFSQPTSKQAFDQLNGKFAAKHVTPNGKVVGGYVAVNTSGKEIRFITRDEYKKNEQFWKSRKMSPADLAFNGREVVSKSHIYPALNQIVEGPSQKSPPTSVVKTGGGAGQKVANPHHKKVTRAQLRTLVKSINQGLNTKGIVESGLVRVILPGGFEAYKTKNFQISIKLDSDDILPYPITQNNMRELYYMAAEDLEGWQKYQKSQHSS